MKEKYMGTTVKTYGKLVRDGMHEIVIGGGFRTLSSNEKKEHLREKLIEEVLEYNEAEDEVHQLEELADVYAVLEELAGYHGGLEAVLDRARRKEGERGGFKKGLYLIYACRNEKKGL